MLSLYQSTRPVVALGAFVAASLFAADSVTIRAGDTLSELAVEHDVTVGELIEWNDIGDPDRIVAGRTLVVSAPGSTATPTVYIVQEGDTLSEIAVRFGARTSVVAEANDIGDIDHIYVGQTLALASSSTTGSPAASSTDAPSGAAESTTYTVMAGDTLSEIAEDHGLRTSVLSDANGITNRDLIRLGQTLVIPAGSPTEPAATPDAPAPPGTSDATAPAPTTTTAAPAPTTTVAPAPAPVPAPAPTPSAPAVATVLTPLFERWSQSYGVPQDLLEALAMKESSWRPDEVGPDGHLGIGQLSPATVTFVEERLLGLDLDPLAASDGIRMASRYLRYLMDRTASDREALAAWNQGLSGVQASGISADVGAFADAVLAIRDQRT